MQRRTSFVAAVLASVLAFAATAGADAPNLVPPKLEKSVEPTYPAAKKASGEHAKVVLTLTVDETGKVTDAVVVGSAGAEFDAAALDASKGLVFAPATRDGKPIPAKIPFSFEFAVETPAPVVAAPPKVAEVGALRGTLRTGTEEPLPGATITVKKDGKTVGTATSDAKGAFAFEGLAAATYEVSIECEGFTPSKSDETIVAGQVTAVVYRPTAIPSGTDIVVVGQKPPREVTRHVLEAAEIQKIPGTNGDALRSIENMPGVARPPSVIGALIVRGSGPSDTSVFVEGVQIPIAYHFGGLTSVIPSELLDRIDFYPGNYALQYGRAMGGIVDIGLRSPKKEWHGLLQFDLLDGRVMVEGPITERTRFIVGVRRSWIDTWLGPVLKSAGQGVTAAPVYYDGQLVVEHDISEKVTAKFAAYGSSDRLEFIFNTPPAGDPITSLGISTKFFRVQGTVEARVAPGVKWTSTLGWGVDDVLQTFNDNKISIVSRPLTVRSDVRARLDKVFTLGVGIDYQHADADIALRVPPIPQTTDTPGPFFARPVSTFDFSASVNRPGAYAVLETSPQKGIKLLPGVRVDYTSDAGKWTVSPRLAARADIVESPRTTLKGGVGVFRQPPEGYQSIAPYGTPGLKDNRSIHYSMGFEQELGKHFELSLEGFYKKLDQLVVQSDAASTSASGASFANTGTGKVYGAEVLARWKNDGRLFGWVAYTLSRSVRTDGAGKPEHLFEYDQTHIFTALASYKLGAGWQVGARFRYVSGNPYTAYTGGVLDADAGGYSAIPGAFLGSRSAAFHRLDLRVDKTWKFQSWQLGAYLDVQNVYNRQNPEGQEYNYNYSRSQPLKGLPILPIVGLRGEM